MQPTPLGEDRHEVFRVSTECSRWNWLRLARIAWIVLAVILMGYFLVSLPDYYRTSLTICRVSDSVDCSAALLTDGNVRALAQLHLSDAAYVGFIVVVGIAGSLSGWALAILIFLRRSRERTGLLFSTLLMFVSATDAASLIAGITVTAETPPLLQLLVALSGVLAALQGVAIAALLLTFPTGRLTPRWSWFLILVVVILSPLPGSSNPAVNASDSIAWILTYIAMVGVQVYRYARVYDAVQRQQTKWFVLALGVNITLLVILHVPGVVVPSLGAPDSWYQLLGTAMSPFFRVFLLLSLGVAILRYRLWDIDVLINRALVYATLTALVVGLYFGLILGLQAIVRTSTGSLTEQPLVVVASTLAIAALFHPLRRRVQSTIDGRFYRRKYDAAKVVADFSSVLGLEVDLEQMREQVLAVVEESMQPTTVSLWLRPGNMEK